MAESEEGLPPPKVTPATSSDNRSTTCAAEIDEDSWDWGEGEAERPVVEKVKLIRHPKLNYYMTEAQAQALQQCPYNRDHEINPNRFTIHLVRCQRNYKDARIRNPTLPEMVPCRFNWQHHIAADKYKAHFLSCPDAAKAVMEDLEYEEAAAARASLAAASTSNSNSNPIALIPDSDSSISTTITDDSSVFTETSSTSNLESLGAVGGAPAYSLSLPQNFSADENWDEETDWTFDQAKELAKKHAYFMPSGMAPAQRRRYREQMVRQFAAEQAAKKEEESKNDVNLDDFD